MENIARRRVLEKVGFDFIDDRGITTALVRSTCSHMGSDSDERADLAAFRAVLPAPQLLPSAR